MLPFKPDDLLSGRRTFDPLLSILAYDKDSAADVLARLFFCTRWCCDA